MVAHRLVEALRARDTGSAFRVTVLAEEDRAPYDRVGLSAVLLRARPRGPGPGRPGAVGRPPGDPAHRLGGHEPWTARPARSRPPTAALGLRRPGPRHGVLRLGAAGARRGPARASSSTARSTTSSRCATGCAPREVELGRPGAGRRHRRRAARARGRRGARRARGDVHRRRVRTATDGRCRSTRAAARRCSGSSRAWASTCGSARHPSRSRPTATAGWPAWTSPARGDAVPSTSSCSPPGCGPATSSPRRPGLATGRARRRGRRRGVPHGRPRRLGDRRGRLHRAAAAWAWSRPATRWPRSSSTGCSAATATFPGADLSTKLKLLGVDVASFGDAFATTPGALELVYSDPVAGVYTKLVVTDDARTLLGGVLVGDASAYASLRPMVGAELGGDPALWLLPEDAGADRPQTELPATPRSAPATTSPPGPSATP